jgi:predicted peptidase
VQLPLEYQGRAVHGMAPERAQEVRGPLHAGPADRIYLTEPSLGGSGTWYLAARYPETFATIAPMSGFTSHLDDIDKNIDKLVDVPIWAFHGKLDTVVPFEETERIVKRLEGRNRNLRFSAEPDLGHSIHWQIYPGQELYDWLLRYDRRSRE